MADVGRPSELNDELTSEIRKHYLEGKNYQEIQQLLGIPSSTWEGWYWKNYKGFADFIHIYKHEKLLRKAEGNLEEFLAMSTTNQGMTMKGELYKYRDAKLADVKAKVTTFVAETLGRQDFHKKKELDHSGEFTTYEIIEGDEEASVPVSAAATSVAEANPQGVGSESVQSDSVRA